jgi:putative transposase
MDRQTPSFVPGATYFFTVTLADRKATLLVDRIDALGAAFRACRTLHPFNTLAIVALPDHLHCIWTLPPGDGDCATRWSLIKRAFTRRQHHEGPRPAGARKRIWQPGFLVHPIRDEDELGRCIDCIHHNPVKHGVAQRAAEWPHSSFQRYLRQGRVMTTWIPDRDGSRAALGNS